VTCIARLPAPPTLTPRRYNPCRVLADSRSLLQSSLSLALALQFLTPKFSASFVTPSIHLRFGLPVRLLPSGLSKVIFLHGRLSCIHITCPAHLSLLILIVVTRSPHHTNDIVLRCILISILPLHIWAHRFSLIFSSKKIQDVTHPPCSGPRFPPYTSELRI